MEELVDEARQRRAARDAEPDPTAEALAHLREDQLVGEAVSETTRGLTGEDVWVGAASLAEGPVEEGAAHRRGVVHLVHDLVVDLLVEPRHTGEDRRFDLGHEITDVVDRAVGLGERPVHVEIAQHPLEDVAQRQELEARGRRARRAPGEMRRARSRRGCRG